MTKTINLLALTSLALVACGDNKSVPDAARRRDGAPADAYCSNCPAAPAIGTTQIDRMGRPAINTALNKAFTDESPTTTPGDAAKDAYNADSNKTTWQASYTGEFASNIAILDVVDGGAHDNGLCEFGETMALNPTECPSTVTGSGTGCGNSAGVTAYSTKTSPVMAYGALAGILADDRLYVDTSKTTCAFYLAVEFGALATPNTTCGGRAPAYDVIDFTYSALAAGFGGFNLTGFVPKYGDGVGPHTDYLAAFPYLGLPH